MEENVKYYLDIIKSERVHIDAVIKVVERKGGFTEANKKTIKEAGSAILVAGSILEYTQ